MALGSKSSFRLSCQASSVLEKEIFLSKAIAEGMYGCRELDSDKNIILEMYFPTHQAAKVVLFHLEKQYPGSLPLLENCKRCLAPDGFCIWSGLMLEERDIALEHIRKSGWRLYKELEMGEWWCAIMQREML